MIARAGTRAVHLTLLKPDGSGKADVDPNKKMIGPVKGSPIILAPPNDNGGLAITEGIEDALTVHEATGLGAWAAGAAPSCRIWRSSFLNTVECVTVFADADAAGQTKCSRLSGGAGAPRL